MAKRGTAKRKGGARRARQSRDVRLSAHPRAQRQIRDAKAWAGIVGFVLVFLLSLQASQPLFDAGLRALVAGLVCYVLGWALAVAVWRHVARAEVMVAKQRFESSSS